MYKFTINAPQLYLQGYKSNWRYFLSPKRKVEGIKIEELDNKLVIHIKEYYCIICNDLIQAIGNPTVRVTCTKQAYNWLHDYREILKNQNNEIR